MDERAVQRPDPVLLAAFALLISFGLVMVYSASFPVAYTDYGNQTFYLMRQLTFAVLGAVGMRLMIGFPYRMLRHFSVPLMIVTLALLLLVLVLPGEMTEANGAARWIRLGPIGIQPSEIAKLAAIIYFADWLSKRGSKIRNLASLANFAIALGLIAGLVMLEPDMGTTIVIVMIGAMILFASGASLLHLTVAAGLAVGAGWILIQSASYRMARLIAYRDPWQVYDTAGYQPIHSLYGLASGGVFGVGLGSGRQKFHWLPFSHTDAILSVIGEELGLIGTLALLLAFVLIAFRGYRIAARLEDPFGALIAVGVTSWIVFQALLNIAVVSTLVPFTGVTLPFISYGGSSLTMTMLAAGLLLNLSRYAVPLEAKERDHADRELFFREWVTGLAYLPLALWRRNRGARVSGARSSRGAAARRDSTQPAAGSFAVGQPISGTWRQRVEGAARQRSRVRASPLRQRGVQPDLRRERWRHGRADRGS